MKKKNKFLLIFISVILLALYFFNKDIKYKMKIHLSDNNVIKYNFFKKIIKTIKDPRYFLNDYNVNFLPQTEFIDFKIHKLKIDKNKDKYKNNGRYNNFIEIIEDKLFIITSDGDFLFSEIPNKNYDKKILNTQKINVNQEFESTQILGSMYNKDYIYISYKLKIDENCTTVGVARAKIDLANLYFKELFNLGECAKGLIWGGAISFYTNRNLDGILLTTSDTLRSKDEDKTANKDLRAQIDESYYNKILLYSFNNNNFEIYSRGHRNPIGLFVENNLIISTEHGPRGGDEINLIKKNNNFGWPISSYGDLYWSKDIEPYYKKNHSEFGFIEPIFSFVPSIGISEIAKVPDNFSPYWKNNFLIGSLYGQSIYRIKFDEAYSKILFSEKIFIGERVRDIKFYKNNSIVLSIEDGLDLAILIKNWLITKKEFI